MRIFKTKWFARFAQRAHIDDYSLNEAIERANNGFIDAELGGNITKLRISRKGQGRSSGYRTLIAYQKNKRAVFLYGFRKMNVTISKMSNWKHLRNWLRLGLN